MADYDALGLTFELVDANAETATWRVAGRWVWGGDTAWPATQERNMDIEITPTAVDLYERIGHGDYPDADVESGNYAGMSRQRPVEAIINDTVDRVGRLVHESLQYKRAHLEAVELVDELRDEQRTLTSGIMRAWPGAARIAYERARTIEVEKLHPTQDLGHDAGTLADAALAYIDAAQAAFDHARQPSDWARASQMSPPDIWPFDVDWWKPSDDPIRNLEKAGALLAGEIDRELLDRARTDLAVDDTFDEGDRLPDFDGATTRSSTPPPEERPFA